MNTNKCSNGPGALTRSDSLLTQPGCELTGKQRQFLYSAGSQFRRRDLTFKQLIYLKAIVDKLSGADSVEYDNDQDLVRASRKDQTLDIRHITVRLAWHDKDWNGRICCAHCRYQCKT